MEYTSSVNTTAKMIPVMVKTKTDKSRIDLAGVDWGEKMLEMLDEEG